MSLPTLHPAIVHFPIVLVPLAVFLDGASLATKGRRVPARVAALAWFAAALAATAAFVAGRVAADNLVGVPPQVQPLIGDHADWAERTLILTWTVALLHAALDRVQPRAALVRAGQGSVLAGGLLAVLFVGWTADRGGLLVYGHGLAVAAPPPVEEDCEPAPAAAPAPSSSPGDRLTRDADGTVTWTPAPGDLSAEGSPVEVGGGVSEGDAGGATLVIDGRGLLALPQVMSDVQVNVWLDLSGFEGEVGVVHHLGEPETGGAFTVSTGGAARLVELGGSVLDEAALDPAGLTALSVSAAGSHYKGLVDGKVITHGHGPELPPGRVGLLLDGAGQVRLHRIEAIPLESH